MTQRVCLCLVPAVRAIFLAIFLAMAVIHTTRLRATQQRTYVQRENSGLRTNEAGGNRSTKEIFITSWTKVQPNQVAWFEEGDRAFKDCPNLDSWMKCRYKSDPGQDDFKKSDAVLFHARHLKSMPSSSRNQNQKWVFYETESPTNVWYYVDRNLEIWKQFNITATYTLDSDIPLHYHRLTCKKKNVNVEKEKVAQGKKKKVVWFVSHCHTSSWRELYARELAKYITVDIFGDCGNKTECRKMHYDGCTWKYLADYKFYLSFENAFCQEYYTEKFHDILKMDILPIVLGKADYANLIPKDAYLNVADFESPQSLAQYLHQLDKNDTAYDEYFAAKKSYDCKILEYHNSKHRFQCQLCEYLHRHRNENQQILDAASFWSVRNRCQSPKEFYRGVADDIIPDIKFGDKHGEEFSWL